MLVVIDQFSFRNLKERVSFYLRRQLPIEGGRIINIYHIQIANNLNTSKEVVLRLLKKMEQRVTIRLIRNGI